MDDPRAGFIGVEDVARLLELSPKSIRDIPAAELPFWRKSSKGPRKYRLRDVVAYVETRTVRA